MEYAISLIRVKVPCTLLRLDEKRSAGILRRYARGQETQTVIRHTLLK